MANIIRSAKSSSDWNTNDLLAHNITISPVPPDEFFPSGADPSLDHLDPMIFTTSPGNPSLSHVVTRYLYYLDRASIGHPTQESSIDDFSAETLKLLDFEEDNATVSMHYTIPLMICGESNHIAQMDVCLLHHPAPLVLLVLTQDKTMFSPAPQVVAEAIAAFQLNNRTRNEQGCPSLNAMTIPCISICGTRPIFYLVPVTEELSNAVAIGQYPATPTEVLQCVTVLRPREGMEDIEYRKLALRRILAFKTLAKGYWEPIVGDVESGLVDINI